MVHTTIISVEGNIGSGKTTLLTYIKSCADGSNVVFLKEPVDEWNNIRDENNVTILERFYADQAKYSFSFQIMAYISRLNNIREAVAEADRAGLSHVIIITERSLFTDKMVFAKMLYDSGMIELINYKIYLTWFDSFAREYPVDKTIYIRASPETCHHRIKNRSRSGEDVIGLDYLERCHKYHEDMLRQRDGKLLVLDGDITINYVNHNNGLDDWMQQIDEFIH